MITKIFHRQLIGLSFVICHLAFTLSLVSCSGDEVKGQGPDGQGTSYSMRLDANVPTFNDETRAATSWNNGSTVYLRFQSGSSYVAGTAVYNSSTDLWQVTTTAPLSTTSSAAPVEAFYFENPSTQSGSILNMTEQTAVFKANGSYTNPGNGTIVVTARLLPLTWRMHFRGASGYPIALTGSKSTISHYTGFDTSKGQLEQPVHKDIVLTVEKSGYTPYIYGTWDKPDADNTLVVMALATAFKRTVKANTISQSNSFYCLAPTADNYSSAGWETTSAPDITFSVDPLLLTFGNGGGSQTFTIMTNTAWKVYPDPDTDASWLSINNTSGEDNRTITITAAANVSASSRTAVVCITGGNGYTHKVAVTQDGATPMVTVNGKSSETLIFKADGEPIGINIQSNDSWIVTADQPWCIPSPNYGTGNGVVIITLARNDTGSQRTAFLYVTSTTDTSKKVIVGITQSIPTIPTPPPSLGIQFAIPNTSVRFNMMKVEGGTFIMGAQRTGQNDNNYDPDAANDEIPLHRVTLDEYYIGQTEVTQELWQAVTGDNPAYFKSPQHPVEQVSWTECRAFIKQLNTLLADQLEGRQFQLPTEAQWEFAARGGNKSNGYKYSGSNTIDHVAFYYQPTGTGPQDVGKLSANELGLYDMSGNVWEWCQDFYEAYSSASVSNPTGPKSSQMGYVIRGGGWNDRAQSCRVTKRYYHKNSLSQEEMKSVSNQGLRLVLK